MIDLDKLEELARAARDNDMRGGSSLTVEFMAFIDELTPSVAIDLIALVRKQEAELAEARAESANSGTFPNAAVTVDTPEFDELLGDYLDASNSLSHDGNVKQYDALITHIDAHVAQAVARALEGQLTELGHGGALYQPNEWADAWHALRDDVLGGVDGLDNDQINTVLGMLDNYEPAPSAQPGDGELPALPWQTKENRGDLAAWLEARSDTEIADAFSDYGRLCLAVRQPAPVGDALRDCEKCNGHGCTHYHDGEWEGKCASCKGTGVRPAPVVDAMARIEMRAQGIYIAAHPKIGGGKRWALHNSHSYLRALTDFEEELVECIIAAKHPSNATPDGNWPADFRDVIKNAEDVAHQQGRAAGIEEAAKVVEALYPGWDGTVAAIRALNKTGGA